MADDFQALPPPVPPPPPASEIRYEEVSLRKKTADLSLISLIVMIVVWMLVGILVLLAIDLWMKSATSPRQLLKACATHTSLPMNALVEP